MMHPNRFLFHRPFRSAIALPGLAVTMCLLSPHTLRAQWVASDASGVPLPQGNPGLTSDGSAVLTGAGNQPTVTPTGFYTNLTGWWLDAYAPNPGLPFSKSVGLNSFAKNYSTTPSGGTRWFFDRTNTNLFRYSPPFPPDIVGGVKASAMDTLTAYFVWIGANPVPDHADFLIQTQVWATATVVYAQQAGGTSPSAATAIATLGSDTVTVSASARGDNHTASLPGRHLIHVAPSGRIVTITRPASASTDTNSTSPVGVWQFDPLAGFFVYVGADPVSNAFLLATATASAGASGTARPDTRTAWINSSIDPTYHKGTDSNGKPTPVQDVPAADGTISANSVASSESVVYSVHAAGGWTSGSTYLLHCASGDPQGGSDGANTVKGQFTLPKDPICYLVMDYLGSQNSEHAYAHLTDLGDATDETANYYVTFHPVVDGWTRNTMIYHPLPTSGPTNPKVTGEWKVYGFYSNNNPTGTPPNSVTCMESTTVTDTTSGTIGGSQTFTIPGDQVAKAFQFNESMTFSTATATASSESFVAQNPAGMTTYVYYGMGWTERAGTCDVWGTNGYQGNSPWHGHASNLDANGNAVVSWTVVSTPGR